MITVSIHAVPLDSGATSYRAVAGEQFCIGNSPGEALDLINAQLGPQATSTVVVVQNNRPDAFFTADQIKELHELMQRRQTARDQGTELPSSDQARLEELIDAELKAAGERAAALADELGR